MQNNPVTVRRPIIPGFHPDPSLCRVDEDFYLVTSSFEYFPGVPIFHSRDLLNWTRIGNVLSRPEQLRVAPGSASSGIYAPTIRHHGGRFWLVTTNYDTIDDGQLLVWAERPEGPWSDAVFIAGAIGIDPDLAWDEGTCYLTWADSSNGVIRQAPVDLEAGRLLAEPVAISRGTGLAYPEGPHLFQREGWWYLLLAEGGTERGHAVTVFRSQSISGPFEPGPANPILSHRSTPDPVQNTGHADLVELPDGSWALVHLGVRPRGRTPFFHVNGRETFLAGIDWVEGWPVVDEHRFAAPGFPTAIDTTFAERSHALEWISPGRDPKEFAEFPDSGGLLLRGEADATAAVTMLGVRASDDHWSATADVVSGDGWLVVRLDDEHLVRVGIEEGQLITERRVGSMRLKTTAPAPSLPGRLRIDAKPPTAGPTEGGPDSLELGWESDGVFVRLAELDGRYLSTEVAGGFTGRIIGLSSTSTAVFGRFTYTPTPGDAAPAGDADDAAGQAG